MAKCPQCSSRKGKRHCPALATEICSMCCAEHRLRTIACPQDCPHLASEFYQQRRRRDKAAHDGRPFVDALNEMFEDEDRRQLAFIIQADVFYFMREHGELTNGVVNEALEHVESMTGAIVTAGAAPHPLAEFVLEQLHNGVPQTRLRSSLDEQSVGGVLKALRRHVAKTGRPDCVEYAAELRAFFSALDFEADLDYDPKEGAPPTSEEPKRSSGGVILP